MTMAFKSKSITLAAIFVCFVAFSTVAASSSQAVSNAGLQLLKSEKYSIDGDFFTLKTYKQDDMIIYAIGDKVKDKKKVAEYAKKMLTEAGVVPLDVGETCDDYEAESRISDAKHMTTGTGCYEFRPDDFYTHQTVSFSGIQEASWVATDPWLPDQIILQQTTVFDGWNISISVPPSWSKSGNTITWTSAPITGSWWVIVTRPNNEASANLPFGNITDADITDRVDIYVTRGQVTSVYSPQNEIDFF